MTGHDAAPVQEPPPRRRPPGDGARLSAVLRSSTWDEHEAAARLPFLRALLAGSVPLAGYAAMLAQHWFAYRELEAAAEGMAADPLAGPFVQPGLARVPALEADLDALLDRGWRTDVRASAPTRAYCDRLRAVCATWPAGFVAHHYTRYLGDLSGGQVIRRAVEQVYGLRPAGAARFLDFDAVGDPDGLVRRYRALLDAAPWPPGEPTRFVAEVRTAYRLSTAVLAALPARPAATGEHLVP